MKDIIIKAARISEMAYNDSAQVFIDNGYKDVCHIVDEETSTEAFVLEDDKYVYVTFPGTENDESLEDLKTDLRFANRKHFHEMKLHRGFWEAWTSISGEVAEEVLLRILDDGTGSKAKPVIYCGHSLGGAIANLGAATHNPQYCVTFGQPPIGGKKLVARMAEMPCKFIRVVNDGDPVPHSLFWNPAYRQGGELYFFDELATLHINPSIWKRIGLRGIHQFDFSDHAMSWYMLSCWGAFL